MATLPQTKILIKRISRVQRPEFPLSVAATSLANYWLNNTRRLFLLNQHTFITFQVMPSVNGEYNITQMRHS